MHGICSPCLQVAIDMTMLHCVCMFINTSLQFLNLSPTVMTMPNGDDNAWEIE